MKTNAPHSNDHRLPNGPGRPFRLFTRRNAGRLGVIALALTVIGVVAWTNDPLDVHGTNDPPDAQGPNLALARAATGFDLSNATIPKDQILSGGPGKDGIPAILEPKFIAVEEADFLEDADKIVGFVKDGTARAYPLRILVWHEIVNDTVAGQAIAVTYCPLCGTCMVFDREIGGLSLSFGVSGLLYQSDVLMYDHQTDSLWSQLKMECVAGELAGRGLHWLPSEEMTWKAWKGLHPDSEVLSTDTGFGRSYDRTPYGGYERSNSIMFPVPKHRDELPNKEWVVGVVVNGVAKAYPLKYLAELEDGILSDSVGQSPVTIRYDGERKWPRAEHTDTGEAIPHVSAYWFAWQAFYPDTELHTPEGLNAGG